MQIHKAFVVCLLCSGCATVLHVVDPGKAHEMEREERQKKDDEALRANTKDGDCPSAEMCKYRCEHLERALDCFVTGKAAMAGQATHYQGGWKYENVQSGSNPDKGWVHHKESTEHTVLYDVARMAFPKACRAGHLESCQRGVPLFEGSDAPEFQQTERELLTKGCSLGDKAMCDSLSKRKPKEK